MSTFVLDGEFLTFHSFYYGSAVLPFDNAPVLDCASLNLPRKCLFMSIYVPVWGMYTCERRYPWWCVLDKTIGSLELEL